MGSAILSAIILFCVVFDGICSPIESENHTYVEPEYLQNLLATGQYEEFAQLLRIEDVNLVRPAEGNGSKDPMFYEGVGGCKLLLTPSQRKQGTQVGITAGSNIYKWKRSVPYVIDRNGYSATEREAIIKAIDKWNQDFFWYIRYRPYTLLDKDYVMIFNGTSCSSNLGKVGGQQPISLRANGCLKEGIILHEMSHTVGIIHEHDRPDRDQYIRILPQNIPENWQSQYEKYSSDEVNILGPYDYYSVMHYGILAPETNLPAFDVLQEGVDINRIGQRDGQTQIDIDKIKRLYS